MELKFIGTGSIRAKRTCSSILINNNILIDCGNGVYKKLINADINVLDIKTIIITHLHGDHTFDLTLLLSAIYTEDHNHSITIIGPKGLPKLIRKLLFLAFPFTGPIIYFSLKLKFIDSKKLDDYKLNDDISIKSFKVHHGNMRPCYGYILNNNIGITGDAAYNNVIDEVASKVKTFICDCTMSIGNDAHMGVDNIESILKKYDTRIITYHMGDSSRKKLLKLTNNYKNLTVSDDLFRFEL